jgi:hypothetical protein
MHVEAVEKGEGFCLDCRSIAGRIALWFEGRQGRPVEDSHQYCGNGIHWRVILVAWFVDVETAVEIRNGCALKGFQTVDVPDIGGGD